MSRRRACLILTLPILLVSSLVIAQTPQPPPAKPNPAEPEAYKLLEDIASRIPSLRSRNNRMQVSCEVADLIWDKDEKRARSLFEAAIKEFTEVVADYDLTDPDAVNELNLLYQQRQIIVERIASRDPKLALSFLRSSRLAHDPRLGINSESERNLEMHLAGLIAARDPELALKLARSSMAHSLSYNAINLLTRLQQKDAATAQSFYRELVDRVGAEDLAQNSEAVNVVANLLASFQPPKANEETYRKLAELFLERVLALSPADPSRVQQAQNIFHQTRNVMPQIEKYLPARAPSLQQWSRAVERTYDANSQRYNEMNELVQRGTLDELIAAAPRFPAEIRPQIYQQAVWKALNTGDPERARQLVAELISDPAQQKQMIDQIEAHQLWKAISDNKLDDARRLLAKVKRIDQRIQMIAQFAGSLVAKGDKKGAVSLLDEARVSLTDLPGSTMKLNAQLQLARSYSDLDPDQGAALLQAVIVQVNPLIAAAVVLDGFDARYLNEGEWQPRNYSGLGNIVQGLQQTLGQYGGRFNPLGEAELAEASIKRFASANSLAEQLERPEVRLHAQLMLVVSVLQSNNANANRSINISTGRRTTTWIQH